MPEGHTLHRLARLHQRRFGRAPVTVSSPQGRFVDGAAAVDGRILRRASAWGKHLFHHYAGGRVVHVHLGLYGTFTEAPIPMPLPVGQVRMRMVGAEYGADLRGPTVCEVIDEAQIDDVVARLGPDPLRRDEALQLAVDLYRGPFLDGFALPDSPEFEDWSAGDVSLLEGQA